MGRDSVGVLSTNTFKIETVVLLSGRRMNDAIILLIVVKKT